MRQYTDTPKRQKISFFFVVGLEIRQAFASILTQQWRENPGNKRIRILTHQLNCKYKQQSAFYCSQYPYRKYKCGKHTRYIAKHTHPARSARNTPQRKRPLSLPLYTYVKGFATHTYRQTYLPARSAEYL